MINTITDKIYLELFGRSQDSLIHEAKGRKDYGAAAGIIYDFNDEDESMRDCLSKEALAALGKLEGDLSTFISMTSSLPDVTVGSLLISISEFVENGAEVIRQQHGGTIPLWDERD